LSPDRLRTLYMQRIGKKTNHLYDQTTEFAEPRGRPAEDVVLEDAPTVAEYFKTVPKSKLVILHAPPLSVATLSALGYSDFEWGIRKGECSLDLGAVSRARGSRADGVVKTIIDPRRDGRIGRHRHPGLTS